MKRFVCDFLHVVSCASFSFQKMPAIFMRNTSNSCTSSCMRMTTEMSLPNISHLCQQLLVALVTFPPSPPPPPLKTALGPSSVEILESYIWYLREFSIASPYGCFHFGVSQSLMLQQCTHNDCTFCNHTWSGI